MVDLMDDFRDLRLSGIGSISGMRISNLLLRNGNASMLIEKPDEADKAVNEGDENQDNKNEDVEARPHLDSSREEDMLLKNALQVMASSVRHKNADKDGKIAVI